MAELWHLAKRPVPSNTAWTYPATSRSGNPSTMSIALLSDWATGGPQV